MKDTDRNKRSQEERDAEVKRVMESFADTPVLPSASKILREIREISPNDYCPACGGKPFGNEYGHLSFCKIMAEQLKRRTPEERVRYEVRLDREDTK